MQISKLLVRAVRFYIFVRICSEQAHTWMYLAFVFHHKKGSLTKQYNILETTTLIVDLGNKIACFKSITYLSLEDPWIYESWKAAGLLKRNVYIRHQNVLKHLRYSYRIHFILLVFQFKHCQSVSSPLIWYLQRD